MNTRARRNAILALVSLEESGSLGPHGRDTGAETQRASTKLIKGTLRYRILLDQALDAHSHTPLTDLDPIVRSTLRVAAFELSFLRTPPHACVNEAVSFVREQKASAASYVNAVLRKIASLPPKITAPRGLQDVLPESLARRWAEAIPPEKHAAVASALLTEAPLTLRVNPLRSMATTLADRIRGTGADVVPSTFLPNALLVRGNPPIRDLPGYAEGCFYVQNEAAQIPAILLDPKPGETILDAAAAPGGKTTQLAEMTNNQAKIVALDRNDAGLARIAENVKRLGAKGIEMVAGDLLRPASGRVNAFDRVLLDAPCSSWGILREHPEWRWVKDAEAPAAMAQVQRTMLDEAIRLVHPGGVVVYSVCTFSPEETVGLMESFVRAHPGVTVEDPRTSLPAPLHPFATAQFVRTLPGDGELDGFFMFRFRRPPS